MMRASTTDTDRRSFIRLVGGSSVAVGSSMLAGCYGGDPEDDDDGADDDSDGTADDDTEPDDAQMGGELRVGMTADAGDPLYPHTVNDTTAIIMCENIGNALVQLNADGEVEPDLAEDWEISDDETEYTFHLREGVHFHPPYDDQEVTAEVVVENFHNTLVNGWGGGQYSGILVGDGIDVEDTVYETGEYEVTFDLPQPFDPFFAKQARMSAFGWFSIIPMNAYEEYGDDYGTFETGAWGTGPFMYNPEETTVGTEYVFDANPNYFKEGEHGQLPYVDTLIFEIIAESSVRNSALQAGDIHASERIRPTDIDSLQENDDVVVQTETGTELVSLWINVRNFEPFGKQEVRQALSYATDRDAMVDVVYDGHGEAARSPLPSWSDAYNEDAIYEYGHDPDMAEQLLEEADEEGLEFECTPSNEPRYVDQAEMLQQMYDNVGVDMSVTPVSHSAAWEPMEGEWDDPDVPDEDWHSSVESYTWGFSDDDFAFSTFHPDSGWNRTYWSTDDMEDALERTRTATDPDERQAAYDEFQEIVTENQPKILLTWPMNSQGHRTNVHGLEVFPTEYMTFERTWIDE